VLLAEPPTTNYDVHFRIGKIPVRVHPLFWVMTLVFGALSVQNLPINLLVGIAIWTAAVAVSILVHELGHALVAKAYGWPPRIVLYGMGGLAVYSPTRQTRKSRILIDFAGPAAGFLLGGLVLAGVLLSGHSIALYGLKVGSGPNLSESTHRVENFAGVGRLELFVSFMLLVNFFWGLMNLLPIQPLDGGGIAKAIIEKYRPRDAWPVALKLSIGTAIVIGAVGLLLWKSVFLAVLFGMLAYNNWQMLAQLRQYGG
jgi:membrane-associated protease RseP (regulator of RpoE activity)